MISLNYSNEALARAQLSPNCLDWIIKSMKKDREEIAYLIESDQILGIGENPSRNYAKRYGLR